MGTDAAIDFRARLALPALLLAALAHADPSAAPLPQVTVEADRATLERRLYTFVTDITRTATREEPLRVWRSPICPLVAGMPRAQAEFVLARISQAAHTAGAPLAGEKCRPNLYVVFTRAPDALIKTWRARNSATFGGVRGSVAAFDHFTASRRPLRVWYNEQFGAATGAPVEADTSMEGIGLTGASGITVNKFVEDSRLVHNDVMLFSSVIEVVDGNQVMGLQFGQLADYIAMAALTEIDLDAPLGAAPTILQLFAARAAGETSPPGLTSWDTSFLKALYATPQNAVMQRGIIANHMVHALAP
jgi:hypothetical protein